MWTWMCLRGHRRRARAESHGGSTMCARQELPQVSTPPTPRPSMARAVRWRPARLQRPTAGGLGRLQRPRPRVLLQGPTRRRSTIPASQKRLVWDPRPHRVTTRRARRCSHRNLTASAKRTKNWPASASSGSSARARRRAPALSSSVRSRRHPHALSAKARPQQPCARAWSSSRRRCREHARTLRAHSEMPSSAPRSRRPRMSASIARSRSWRRRRKRCTRPARTPPSPPAPRPRASASSSPRRTRACASTRRSSCSPSRSRPSSSTSSSARRCTWRPRACSSSPRRTLRRRSSSAKQARCRGPRLALGPCTSQAGLRVAGAGAGGRGSLGSTRTGRGRGTP
mmetsp:Transcript_23415/g.68959  ORF Transcript_23415/g.68959 Transcript_23415/m.68959 type:complete len:342 (-) Transcript_23415:58-1083(-)